VNGDRGPIREAAYGVTKAIIDSLWEGLKQIPDKLNNRDIAFIGDPETRRVVKEKRASAEWALLRKYIEDRDLWVIVQSGLTLRSLEGDPLLKRRLEHLRGTLHSRFGPLGVQIAEVVQRGILTDLVTHYAKEGATDQQLRAQIGTMLGDLMAHVEFIRTGDDPKEFCRKIAYKVSIRSPQIVMGRGRAVDALNRVARKIKEGTDCHVAIGSQDDQEYLFVFRTDQWRSLTDPGPDPAGRPSQPRKSR
jgi:hypothetical protein